MLVHDAIRWIAKNEDPEIGTDDNDYIMTVCLVGDLFNRKSWEIAKAVRAERAGLSWRFGKRRNGFRRRKEADQ